jgi:hypothetical protein
MKRPGLPNWFWPVLAAACVLALLLEVLLRNTSRGDAGVDGSAGAGVGNRAPFPKGGEFSGVHRATQIEPREKSAPEPWQEGRKSK